MGSSRDVAIGPVAVVSLLLGTMLSNEIKPIHNEAEYMRLAFTATFFAGITQETLGLFSEWSMDALLWALDNLKLRSSNESPSYFLILHVQSPPSFDVGLNPGAIPFDGPSNLEVPAFTAAIEAHQKRITEAIFNHALHICSEKSFQGKCLSQANVKTEVVENLHADLLVMGSRAFGPIKRESTDNRHRRRTVVRRRVEERGARHPTFVETSY